MAKKILTSVSLIVAGAIIGFVTGAILGFVIGRGVDELLTENSFRWRSLYGGISGAVAGLIVGAGTGGLGVRTRFGFEWMLIFGIGTLVGLWFQGNLESDGVVVIAIGAVAGWLVVHLVRSLFRKWLPHGSLKSSVVVVYLFIFALVVFIAAPAMQLIGLIFYF